MRRQATQYAEREEIERRRTQLINGSLLINMLINCWLTNQSADIGTQRGDVCVCVYADVCMNQSAGIGTRRGDVCVCVYADVCMNQSAGIGTRRGDAYQPTLRRAPGKALCKASSKASCKASCKASSKASVCRPTNSAMRSRQSS
jgi:hypothetical protein